jgi:exosortase/archaeosortase family protein
VSVLLVAAYALSSLLLDAPAVNGRLRLCKCTAEVTAALLNRTGLECRARGTRVVPTRGPSFDIVLGCTGFLSMLILLAAFLAYGAPWWASLAGLCVSLPVVFAANLARILAIAWLAVDHSRLAERLHEVGFPVFHLAMVLGCWIVWTKLVGRLPEHRDTPAPGSAPAD